MKHYWTLVGALFFFFTMLYLAAQWLNPQFLSEPLTWMTQGVTSFAIVGTALLIADVLLPVPSSFVMIANGALYGIVLGTILSLIGYTIGGLIGFLIGRRSLSVLARLIPPDDRVRANQLLEQWGWLAILVTRPLPLLAETTAIMAGASTMSWQMMTLATVAGSLPVALLYAITGATAANLDNLLLAFGLAILMAGIFFIASHGLRPVRRLSKQRAARRRARSQE